MHKDYTSIDLQRNLSDSEKIIRPGEYCFIPKGQIHRLSAGDDGVMFIEVQQGICEEEDIVRLSDDYGRS